MRVAAVADVHARVGEEARVEALFRDVARRADALALAGDLTDHGRIEEAEILEKVLANAGLPAVAVLGNHDHESGDVAEVVRVLRDAGVVVLDRSRVVVDGVGFAGVKGFCGGFDERIVRAFGEAPLKAFVAESVAEATALRQELAALPSGPRVAVLHYAPVASTVAGEPPEIHPFLGTSRLGDALDDAGASVAVHGHAHHGSPEGRTPGGVPVLNVSVPVLKAAGHGAGYRVVEV